MKLRWKMTLIRPKVLLMLRERTVAYGEVLLPRDEVHALHSWAEETLQHKNPLPNAIASMHCSRHGDSRRSIIIRREPHGYHTKQGRNKKEKNHPDLGNSNVISWNMFPILGGFFPTCSSTGGSPVTTIFWGPGIPRSHGEIGPEVSRKPSPTPSCFELPVARPPP